MPTYFTGIQSCLECPVDHNAIHWQGSFTRAISHYKPGGSSHWVLGSFVRGYVKKQKKTKNHEVHLHNACVLGELYESISRGRGSALLPGSPSVEPTSRDRAQGDHKSTWRGLRSWFFISNHRSYLCLKIVTRNGFAVAIALITKATVFGLVCPSFHLLTAAPILRGPPIPAR